jgi:hypothetical protein
MMLLIWGRSQAVFLEIEKNSLRRNGTTDNLSMARINVFLALSRHSSVATDGSMKLG